MQFHNDDVLTAIQKEIDRNKRAPLRCRLGFHDASEFWVDMYAHVDVRRCYRCGCALEARDRLRKTVEQDFQDAYRLPPYRNAHWPPAPLRPPPPPGFVSDH